MTMKTRMLLLAVLLTAGGATEAFAWSKDVPGTRGQLRNACVDDVHELIEDGTSSSCLNTTTQITVVCDASGKCTGSGGGIIPREIRTASPVSIATMLGDVRLSVDLTQFHSDTKRKPQPAK